MRKSAFTLIELLVVIAIIAILAAILFPVFAQAKQAAKGAVAISGAKQISLGQIMYESDNDDYFSPVVSFLPNSWAEMPFSYLEQPYMKSWQLLLDPTGPISLADATSGQAGTAMALYGLWGMPPERIDSQLTTSPDDFRFGTQTLGAQMTGGNFWYYDGIGGVLRPSGAPGNTIWSEYAYVQGGVPSLSSTAVARPADQVMVAQSGTYDFMWENVGGYGDWGNYNDTPDNFDLYWGASVYNTYGSDATICGPMGRKNASDGPSAGWFPGLSSSQSIIGNPTQLPTGITVWAGTDGHVSVTPWRQLMGTTVPINNGTQLAIKAFWPSGS